MVDEGNGVGPELNSSNQVEGGGSRSSIRSSCVESRAESSNGLAAALVGAVGLGTGIGIGARAGVAVA